MLTPKRRSSADGSRAATASRSRLAFALSITASRSALGLGGSSALPGGHNMPADATAAPIARLARSPRRAMSARTDDHPRVQSAGRQRYAGLGRCGDLELCQHAPEEARAALEAKAPIVDHVTPRARRHPDGVSRLPRGEQRGILLARARVGVAVFRDE